MTSNICVLSVLVTSVLEEGHSIHDFGETYEKCHDERNRERTIPGGEVRLRKTLVQNSDS